MVNRDSVKLCVVVTIELTDTPTEAGEKTLSVLFLALEVLRYTDSGV